MKIRILAALLSLITVGIDRDGADAQTGQRSFDLSLSSTTVTLLPTFAAHDKGFFRDEGFDVELIHMPATLASTALTPATSIITAPATGVISAAVQGRPMKVLLFTVSRPLMFLVSRRGTPRTARSQGKKVAGSTPGASARCSPCDLRHVGLEPGRDVTILPMGGTAAGRLRCSNRARWMLRCCQCRKTFSRVTRDLTNCSFSATSSSSLKPASAPPRSESRKIPTRSTRMVRAELRALQYLLDKSRHGEIVDLRTEALEAWRP